MRKVAALLFAFLAVSSFAAERSRVQRAAFVRAVPCPETGVTRAACPGWEVDHVVPLCAGGADRADNMQWLSVAGHKVKTRQDVKSCRARRPASADS